MVIKYFSYPKNSLGSRIFWGYFYVIITSRSKIESEVYTMIIPEPVRIVETPKHFWFGPVDLSHALQGDTKVEKLGDRYIVTKSFVVDSYTYLEEDMQGYVFSKE